MGTFRKATVVQAAVTRPDNTTQYAAGDVIGTAASATLTFNNVALQQGGSVIITTVLVDDSANQATKPVLELWLFDAAPPAVVDNAPWAPTDAVMLTRVAALSLDSTDIYVGNATVGAGGNSCQQWADAFQVICAADSQALYGVLVVRNTYTPVAEEVFTVRVAALQD